MPSDVAISRLEPFLQNMAASLRATRRSAEITLVASGHVYAPYLPREELTQDHKAVSAELARVSCRLEDLEIELRRILRQTFGTGPADQAEVTAMKSWKIRAVRVVLNEACWLGVKGASPSGQDYQDAVAAYVGIRAGFADGEADQWSRIGITQRQAASTASRRMNSVTFRRIGCSLEKLKLVPSALKSPAAAARNETSAERGSSLSLTLRCASRIRCLSNPRVRSRMTGNRVIRAGAMCRPAVTSFITGSP